MDSTGSWDYWMDHPAKIMNLLNTTYIRWTTRRPPAYHDYIWLYRSYGGSPLRNPSTCYAPSSSTLRYTPLRRPPAHFAILPSVALQHTSLHSPPSPSSTLRYTPLRRPPTHCAILPSILLVFLCPRTLAGNNRSEVADTGYGNNKGERQQEAGSAVIPPTNRNCFRGLSITGMPWSCELHNNKQINIFIDDVTQWTSHCKYCPLVSNIALSGRNSPKLLGKTCLLTLKAKDNAPPPPPNAHNFLPHPSREKVGS